MVAVDKPAGVAVTPAPDDVASACLRDRVAAQIGTRAWVVHRLDRDTSGIVVFARTAEAHRMLSMALERHDVERRYTAFVHGVPVVTDGMIALPLHAARKGKVRPARPDEPGATPARTSVQVDHVWRHGGAAIARVTLEPLTSRHHQLRVHLRAVGAPIAGDRIYGAGATAPSEVPVTRLALHASFLELPHPSGARRIEIASPWPLDLAALPAWLDAHWPAEVTA